jgi:hypothetical protein
MEGTIHIINKLEQEYWIEGALVDKVTTSHYNYNHNGREAYVHYKSGEVETIPCVVMIEVLCTYKLDAKPLQTTEDELDEEFEETNPPCIFNKDDVLKVLNDCKQNRKKAADVFGVPKELMKPIK